MLKAVFAATAAITIAGSTMAYAQQRDGRPDGARRWQPTTEDMRAFQAARLAALRAGLVLNAEQDRHWPAFEQAMRELQQQRLNRIAAGLTARRDGGRPPVTDPAERMRQRATRLSESGAVLKRLADATDPLYRSLDEAQKRRFAILTRMGGQRGGNEPGMQRGQRRSDVAPTEGTPQAERMAFGSKTLEGATVARAFGTKIAIEEAVLFASKTLTAEPVLFGAKFTPFGGKISAGEGATFSRKIIIGEPPVFGRKAVQSI